MWAPFNRFFVDRFLCCCIVFVDREICIDLSLILEWIWVSFLMVCWYLFRLCTQPAKPSKPLFLHWIYIFYTSEKHVLIFSLSFSLPIMALILMSLGIDLGSILASLWHTIPYFSQRLFLCFLNRNSINFHRIWLP